MRSYLLRATRLKRSSSRFAPVQVMAWTLSWRIISAREIPNSAVLMAPARVIIIFPPRSRCAMYASAASFKTAALKCRYWRSMNWLMLPIFFTTSFNRGYSLLMQNFYRWSQALIAVLPKNFLRYGGKDLRCQGLWRYADQKNCRSKHSHDGSRQQIGRDNICRSCGRQRRLINENRLQHNQVVVKRDEAAEKRDCHEPEQAVVYTCAKRNTEKIKFSEKPGKRRYP